MTQHERPSFLVEESENPNVKSFHTRMILTDYVSIGVSKCEEVVESVDGILDFVMRIPGVTQAQVEPHKLTVIKSPAFGWDEIEPRIISLFQYAKIPELLRYPCPGLQELWLTEQDPQM